jgi:hypothetical protein
MNPASKDMLSKELGDAGAREERLIFNSDDSTGKAVRKRRKPVFATE